MNPRRTSPAVSAPTRIGLAGIDADPIQRSLRLEGPSECLGELPLGFEQLDLEVEIRRAGGEGVRARGTLAARTVADCRRCLEPTEVVVTATWDALFRSSSRIMPGEEGIWALDSETGELDLAGPIREELWLRTPEYVECADDCPGLCPRCGARLSGEACTCPPPGPDPRWAALGNLRG